VTKDEEILLRELAGGRCTIQKVTAAIGPMSLWSKAGLEAEIRKAVEAEREACARIADSQLFNTNALLTAPIQSSAAYQIGVSIRARGQA